MTAQAERATITLDADEREERASWRFSCGRVHEECEGCALQSVEPPQCEGHPQGPVACERFERHGDRAGGAGDMNANDTRIVLAALWEAALWQDSIIDAHYGSLLPCNRTKQNTAVARRALRQRCKYIKLHESIAADAQRERTKP